MEKEKVIYRFSRYSGKKIYARREISYEIQLVARLMLDELCFNWNKNRLLEKIDCAFEEGNKEKFLRISEEYKQYVWE
ncbi:MAG TPA: IDEAL domain-containing protein [Candidatus Avamphibacillus sp.]|nr:IDEAL domain-containing protein [Candidatus Avamphibacillus sp.]